jgi:hypothetical protein
MEESSIADSLVIESVFATSKTRRDSSDTSPAPRPGSPSASRNESSRALSASCSTPSTADPARAALAAYNGR